MAWDWYYPPYVSVAERRAKALGEMEKLRKKGLTIQPVTVEGRKIAGSFWGKGWCDHLESFADYANRLPRGRTYVRNNSVCHLDIQPRRIEAFVSGSALYKVGIEIKPLKPKLWTSIKKQCTGRIRSLLELLKGQLSGEVMSIVSHREEGMFPQPGEMKFSCSCPDWAEMCKHVAAVLYGIGARLDSAPELLFTLRDVDAAELIGSTWELPAAGTSGEQVLDDSQLGAIFGIDLDNKSAAATETALTITAGEKIVSTKPAPIKPSTKKTQSRTSREEQTSLMKQNGRMLAKQTKKAKTVRTTKSLKSAQSFKRARATMPEPSPQSGITTTPSRGRRQSSKTVFELTGKSVARMRKKLGVSAAEFARRLGVTVPTVYRWEETSGRLNLQSRTLQALQTWCDSHP